MEKWKEFFERPKMKDRLLELESLFPGKRDILVPLDEVSLFSIDEGDRLIEHPDIVLAEMYDTLVYYDEVSIDRTKGPIFIQVNGLKEVHYPSRLRSQDRDKLRKVRGVVRSISEVRPYLKSAVFECQRCGNIFAVPQQGLKFSPPGMCQNEACGRNGPFKFRPDLSDIRDGQFVKLQDDLEDITDLRQQDVITTMIEGPQVGMFGPGDHLEVTGIFRLQLDGKSTRFTTRLDALYLEATEKSFSDIKISDEEELEFLAMAQDAGLFDKLVRSVAPSLAGLDQEKKAILLQQISAPPVTLPDGNRIRGDIHVLMVGDPSTGKSELMGYAQRIAPRVIKTTGQGSSAAGLTAAAVRDEMSEGAWTLEAGAMPLADNGLLIIDEFGTMNPSDKNALHDGMEGPQSIHLAKAGIVATMRTRCSILAAENPKHGRFMDPSIDGNSIWEQVNIPSALGSRFDLILPVRDRCNQLIDEAITDRVGIEYDESAADQIVPQVDPETLRRYIAYARSTITEVTVPPEVRSKISARYIDARKKVAPDRFTPGSSGYRKSAIPITTRQLHAIYRLTRAFSRAHLRPVATMDDADSALALIEYSWTQTMVNPDTGEFDVDMTMTNTSSSTRDKIQILESIIKSLQESDRAEKVLGGYAASVLDIIAKADDEGISLDTTETLLERMTTTGMLARPKSGCYRVP